MLNGLININITKSISEPRVHIREIRVNILPFSSSFQPFHPPFVEFVTKEKSTEKCHTQNHRAFDQSFVFHFFFLWLLLILFSLFYYLMFSLRLYVFQFPSSNFPKLQIWYVQILFQVPAFKFQDEVCLQNVARENSNCYSTAVWMIARLKGCVILVIDLTVIKEIILVVSECCILWKYVSFLYITHTKSMEFDEKNTDFELFCLPKNRYLTRPIINRSWLQTALEY